MLKKESKEKLEKEKFHRMFSRRYCWKITIVALLALLIISIFSGGFKDFFTTSVKSQKAAEQSIDYINANLLQGDKAVLKGVSEISSIYKIELEVGGQRFESYMTKDGKFLFPSGIDMTEEREALTQQSQSIQKSNKPVAQAFVFSYCPYGLQFQKALLPVYELLKNKADVDLVAIGAMHGEYEKQESLRQICIQKEYSKDKLWDYLEKFMADKKIGNCRGDMACSDPLVEQIMTQIGIDKDMVNNCMATDAESLYTSQNIQASGLGISGSPTFVVNGDKIQVGRNSEAIKEAICNAFNSPPKECQQTLSTTQASPGFGSGTSTSSGSC